MEPAVDGGVVVESVSIPGTEDVVVLLDPERRPDGVLPWHPFLNVVRVTSAGDVVWRAELVPGETTAKCWIGLEFDGSLRARTFSYECELDPATGRVSRTSFLK